jgi:hypothetical protein
MADLEAFAESLPEDRPYFNIKSVMPQIGYYAAGLPPRILEWVDARDEVVSIGRVARGVPIPERLMNNRKMGEQMLKDLEALEMEEGDLWSGGKKT